MSRLPRMMIALLVLAGVPTLAPAQQWPRFRGPNGAGVGEARIPVKWSRAAYRWRLPLDAAGHGSPVLWGSKLFFNASSADGRQRRVVCVSATDGTVAWEKGFSGAGHKKHRFNGYATGTPTVDEKNVYAMWDTGEQLTAMALTHGGDIVWRRKLGPVKGGHGFGVSPMILGDLLIVPNDQDGPSSLLALDKATGEVRWTLARRSKRLTYSVPCVFAAPGGANELIFTNWTHGITGVDPRKGKVNWELDVFGDDKERAIGSPIVAGDLVIGTCGFVTKDKHVVAIRPASGAAGGKAEEIWRVERSVPHIPTPLLVGEHLYLWTEGGIVTCLNPGTGQVIYRERVEGVVDKFFSSPVAADGKIFCVSNEGKMVVLAAGATFRQLAVNDLGEDCRATPAIANGDMYVRTGQSLICIRGGS
ncbi:MAG: PQQ-like beta-propeller repeat protein [Phycisphaerae bacterium]|nr:PQQ-like beta-propeller repeat protein [Phycisphaerae bacterium]